MDDKGKKLGSRAGQMRQEESPPDNLHYSASQRLAILETIQAHAPIGLAFVDTDFRFVRVNESLAQTNGVSIADHLGHTAEEIVPRLWPQLEPIYRRALAGESVVDVEISGETSARPGEQRHWLASYYPVRVGGDEISGIGIIVLDITDRKRSEDALQESESHYRTLFESMTEGFALGEIILDDNGKPRDWRYLHVNPAFGRITGLDIEKVIGRNVRDLLPNIESYWVETLGRVAMTGESIQVTDRVKDLGKDFEVHAFSPVKGQFAALFVDVTDRKAAEELLRKYQMLSEDLRDIILFVRPDGRIFEANDAAVSAYGFTREELTARTIFDLRTADSLPEAAGQFAAVDTEGILFEAQHRRKDGTAFPVEISARFADIGDQRVFLAIVRDITQRKQAEEALRDSERRVTSVLESITDSYYTLDLDWRITDCNPQALSYLGMEEEDVIGRVLWDVLPYLRGTTLEEQFLRARSTGQPAHFEFLSSESGRWAEVHAYPSELRLSVYFRNITDRKQDEEALRKHAMLLELAHEAILVRGTGDKITYWSRGAEETYGWIREEAMGRVTHEILKTRFPKPLAEINVDLAKEGGWAGELTHTRKDGREIVVASRWAIQRDESGHQIGVLEVNRDITERKRAEEAMQASVQEFQALAQSIPQIVWATRPDGWNIYFNQQWVDYTGMTLEESYGHGWNIPFHPDDRRRAWDAWQNAVQNDETYSLECRLRRADGAYRWWLIRGAPLRNANGKITKWFGTCTDIEDIKQAEEALRESEERLRLTNEAARTGTWQWDLQAGVMTWDAQSSYFLGLPTNTEMSYEVFLKTLHPDDRLRVQDAVSTSIDRHVDYDVEFRVVWPDDSVHWVHGKGHADYDDSGAPMGMVGTCQDITERKRNEQLSNALNDINLAMRSTLDFEAVLKTVLAQSAEALGVESGSITMTEGKQWVVRYAYGLRRLAIGTRFSDAAFSKLALAAREKRLTVVNDVRNAGGSDYTTAEEYDIRAFVAIPLIVGDETVGILWLNNHSGPFTFGDAETDFATKLGASISLALENVRLYEAERDAKGREEDLRARLQGQHREMQQALLPREIPAFDCCEVAARFVAGTHGEQIGGDFYDVFETEDGKIAVLIGDVAGKGIEAGAMAAVARSTVRAFAYELASPGDVLMHTNSVLCGQGFTEDRFATVFLAVLDPDTGRLTYSSAGHPPAMILRADGKVDVLTAGSLPIRVVENVNYQSLEADLAPGDKLVTYTDGISEARRGEHMYDVRGIEKTLQSQPEGTPEEILDMLFCVAADICQGALIDDAAVAIIERRPNTQYAMHSGPTQKGELSPAPIHNS